jgi:hypothetical protein
MKGKNKMKKIFLIGLSVVLLITGCASKSDSQNNAIPTHSPQIIPQSEITPAFSLNEEGFFESEDVSLRLITDEINPLTLWLDFEIVNHSGNEYSYGEEFALYTLEDGLWVYNETLPQSSWNAHEIILMPFSSNHGSISIDSFFGTLDEGFYRIEKDIFSAGGGVFLVTTEFEVEEIEK